MQCCTYFCSMKKCFALVLLMTSTLLVQAQWRPQDSIRRALDLNAPGGFRVSFDGRNSFLKGQAINVGGARFGLDYGKIALYTGVYRTSMSLFRGEDSLHTGFNYVSSTLEYYIHQSWRFEVVNSYQIGFGTVSEMRKVGNTVTRRAQGYVIPLETGIGGTVRFLRYLGFCAGVGIRVGHNRNISGFSGSYYYYGFTCFTGTMYRDFRKLVKRI